MRGTNRFTGKTAGSSDDFRKFLNSWLFSWSIDIYHKIFYLKVEEKIVELV